MNEYEGTSTDDLRRHIENQRRLLERFQARNSGEMAKAAGFMIERIEQNIHAAKEALDLLRPDE